MTQNHHSAGETNFAPGSSWGVVTQGQPIPGFYHASPYLDIQQHTMAHNSVFPAFTDGDVHITITGSRQYTLHSTILKNCSPVMVQLLDEQWAAKLSAKAVKRGATIKHRLIMVDDNDDESSIAYVLEPVQVNDEGKAVTHHPIGLDLENGRVVSPTVLVRHQNATRGLTDGCYRPITQFSALSTTSQLT